ncbi:carbohydrate ABC transporter substrate-binding protein [Streptomyces sp. 11x1]|uniref:carbohydrate ABC transporter substrate-binding protein n=1 Tax=Streptomyces sp. 11x1 TaxID=3038642 RepID=UPI00292CE7EB|nr:carbohydrate ABC transporter substrate-binding protein [Streptomyces sp. 11x1]WNZ09550.1 extracellular solute-binding protein [Streptomyces sp. 11x1]
MTRRFKVLVLLAALLLVCAGGMVAVWSERDDEPVTILGPWTDKQGEQFEDVLRSFGIPFEYQGTAAQREVLLSKVQSGEPPDIAIMPGVGELAEYADQNLLKSLNGLYTEEEYGAPWKPVSSPREDAYWVPVKADLKSIVWYREGQRPANSPAPLTSWCIGMGDDGASGWPGSDWIEDLVLQREGPEIYGKWALGDASVPWTGTAVREAWEAWAGLLRQDEAAAGRALLTDHRGAPGEYGLLFEGKGGCALEHQGSFARSFYGDKWQGAGLMDSAPLLPGGGYRVRGHEVTGDFAALFSDRPRAGELIERLASREGQRKWSQAADVFSANRRVRQEGGPVEREIAKRLTGTGPRCLDASDVMPPAVRDAFYEAVLLTIARAAAGEELDVPGLLADVQNVAEARPDRRAPLSTVCST